MFSTAEETFKTLYKIGTYSFLTPTWNFTNNKMNTISKMHNIIFAIFVLVPLLVLGFQTVDALLALNEESFAELGILITYQIVLFTYCFIILFNKYNLKWHRLLSLMGNHFESKNINTDLTKKTPLYKNPIFFQIWLSILIFLCTVCIHGQLYYYELEVGFPKIFVWMFMVSYSFLIYITCYFPTLLFCIIVVIGEKLKCILYGFRKMDLNICQNRNYINEIQIQYRQILDLCDIFNVLFGNILLFVLIISITQLLVSFNDTLNYFKSYATHPTYLLSPLVGIINTVKLYYILARII